MMNADDGEEYDGDCGAIIMIMMMMIAILHVLLCNCYFTRLTFKRSRGIGLLLDCHENTFYQHNSQCGSTGCDRKFFVWSYRTGSY